MKKSLEETQARSGQAATGREDVAKGHRGAKERGGSPLGGVEWGIWERNGDEGWRCNGDGKERRRRRQNAAGD